MLSRLSSTIAWLLAVDYALLGVGLFFAPDLASEAFAWNVSPLVTMTIGAWCLGSAFAAGVAASRRLLALVASTVLYLVVFGLTQLAVLRPFQAQLQLADRPLSWLYLAGLGLSVLLGMTAAVDAIGSPARHVAGARLDGVSIVLTLFFIACVGFLGWHGLTTPVGGRGLHEAIFPETLSVLSVHSFGAFYLALALGAVPLPLMRRRAMFQTHAFALYGLLILITAATATFADTWHFRSQPRQFWYPGLHLLVGLIVGFYLLRYGTGSAQEPKPPRRES